MWTAPAISLWAPWTQHFCGRGVWHFSKIPQNLACLLQNSLFCCSQVLDVFWFGFLFSPSPFLAETNYLLCVFPLAEVWGEFSVRSAALRYVAWASQERSVQRAAGRRKKLEICSQAAQSADWKLRFGGCGGNQRRLTAGVDQEHLLFWLIGHTLFGSNLTAEGLRVFALFSRWANSIIKNTRRWKYFLVYNFAMRIFNYEPWQGRNENYFMLHTNLISLPERELWKKRPPKYPQRV